MFLSVGDSAAEGDDGGVFEEEEGFFAACQDLRVGFFLGFPGGAVGDEAQVDGTHR